MTNPTSSFGWVMPSATDLVTDLPADFEVFGQAVDTDFVGLKGGTTGQVLAKASATDLDFVWSADAAGMTNPMTTTGDVIYSSSGSTPARLGIGSTDDVLTVAGGVPTWAAPAGAAAFAGASVYNSADQTIPPATYTAVVWNSEYYDTDAFHDNSTNTSRMTIPAGKAGKYSVYGLIQCDGGSTNSRSIQIYKNGAMYSVAATTPSGAYPSLQISGVLDLVATDYVEIYVFQSTGGSVTFYKTGGTGIFNLTYLGA